jgi:nicotinate dehydrogenase subunit A
MSERIRLVVDGKLRELAAEPAMPLLYALRADLALNNPKFGCGLAQCGACTCTSTAGRRAPASHRSAP